MVLFTVLGKLSIKNASHLKKTPEFMNSFGAVIMMLFISSHTYIKLQFYSMHKMIKSGGMTNPFALYTATIMKCKEEASTWFDQMFWDTWTDITFFDLIFCKNTVSSILNPWSGVMFLSMMWFFAFHRNIRSPSLLPPLGLYLQSVRYSDKVSGDFSSFLTQPQPKNTI